MKTDAAGRDLDSAKVFMVQEGIIGGWVCAPKYMSLEDVQLALDANGPYPGTSGNRWIVREGGHSCGDENCTNEQHDTPGMCLDDETRQHWYVYC